MDNALTAFILCASTLCLHAASVVVARERGAARVANTAVLAVAVGYRFAVLLVKLEQHLMTGSPRRRAMGPRLRSETCEASARTAGKIRRSRAGDSAIDTGQGREVPFLDAHSCSAGRARHLREKPGSAFVSIRRRLFASWTKAQLPCSLPRRPLILRHPC
jgi:hypothetical protein